MNCTFATPPRVLTDDNFCSIVNAVTGLHWFQLPRCFNWIEHKFGQNFFDGKVEGFVEYCAFHHLYIVYIGTYDVDMCSISFRFRGLVCIT